MITKQNAKEKVEHSIVKETIRRSGADASTIISCEACVLATDLPASGHSISLSLPNLFSSLLTLIVIEMKFSTVSSRKCQSFVSLIVLLLICVSFSSGMRLDSKMKLARRSKKASGCGSQNEEKPAPETSNGDVEPSFNADSQWAANWLNIHNKVRKFYNVGNLVWNETLAKGAAEYAEKCDFVHSGGDLGEDLAVGQTSIDEVVSEWVLGQHECAGYDPANIEISHFTQVVWKDTLQLGCWRKMCPTVGHEPEMKNVYYWICRYGPCGNVGGEYPQNVKAKKGQCPPKSLFNLPGN
ncbi:hypothetical protein O181_032350 [Austropuccinia psidii MF-1]|uniref:SCP domain-containing protein n=1 Tax=Austropuccinia psidii MF-1 TaxID=1389203 RepID=A0A9Q3D0V5_9BASI|nr:hypothetical protein [Austropuccinia psidii MF-1]